MSAKLGELPTGWIKERIKLAQTRLVALEKDKTMAAVYEREMHKADIAKLKKELKERKWE